MKTHNLDYLIISDLIQRLCLELARAEGHLYRIYRASGQQGIVESECSAALGAILAARHDLSLCKPS